MKLVHIEDVEVKEVPHVREGVFLIQMLHEGTPGTPGNFSLQLVRIPETYFSPRHKHNFDQFRYQIEGEFSFEKDGKMGPGSLGYFPEGTPYGPQSNEDAGDLNSLTLVLQFGGASGSGYISREEYSAAQQELSRTGKFEKGVYSTQTPEGKKINKDAYEAIWEHINGRDLIYPKMRYQKPVFMEQDNFDWVRLEQGVRRKLLGVFTERQVRLAFWKVREGASLSLEDNSLYFIEDGEGAVDGQSYARHTSFHIDRGETLKVTAKTETILLQFGLPYLG